MILKQYYLGCLADASYLVADEASGVAAVVDPQRDVDVYVEDAHRIGCRIAHMFLTHFHADFVAGHLELRDREGAQICLGARAEAEYDFMPLAELYDPKAPGTTAQGQTNQPVKQAKYSTPITSPRSSKPMPPSRPGPQGGNNP